MNFNLQQIINDIIERRDPNIISSRLREILPILKKDELEFITSFINNNNYKINLSREVNILDDFNKYSDDELLNYFHKYGKFQNKYNFQFEDFMEHIFCNRSIKLIRRIFMLSDLYDHRNKMIFLFDLLVNNNHHIPNREEKLVFLLNLGLKINKKIFDRYVYNFYQIKYNLRIKNNLINPPIIDKFIELSHTQIDLTLNDILILFSKNIFIKSFDYSKEIEMNKIIYISHYGDINSSVIPQCSYYRSYPCSYIFNTYKSSLKCYEGFDLLKLQSKISKGFNIFSKKEKLDDSDTYILNKKLKYDFNEDIFKYIPDKFKKEFKIKKEISFSEFKKMYLNYLMKNKMITKKDIIIDKRKIPLNELNYEIMNLLE